jgi:cell division initiation protein
MALAPIDIQKMRFNQRMRGFDTTEVEGFLVLMAEELAGRLAQIEKLDRENKYYRQRLEETMQREHQLQQTLLRAQKVSDEITNNARREAELTVKEAEMMADKIVQQAIDQSTRIESKIGELRMQRRELQLKFKNTLDYFQRSLEEEMDDEQNNATVHTLPRRKKELAKEA